MAQKSCENGETKRILFLRNKAEKLLKIKDRVSKTNRKQTENKATEVIENKRSFKKQTENKPEIFSPPKSLLGRATWHACSIQNLHMISAALLLLPAAAEAKAWPMGARGKP